MTHLAIKHHFKGPLCYIRKASLRATRSILIEPTRTKHLPVSPLLLLLLFAAHYFLDQFSIPSALHGQDVAYTFYSGPNPIVTNTTVALALQAYLTSFVVTCKPTDTGLGIPSFPMYGPRDTELDLGIKSIATVVDNTSPARCLWWQKALYY